MKKPVAVLLSGGMDSTTLLALADHEADPRLAVSVDYGQRHQVELEAAEKVAAYYGVEHLVLDFTGWGKALSGSALTDPGVAVPDGEYDEENMSLTVVPNRNATMLMAVAGIAAARGLQEVWTAVHAGDHSVYPDCRPEFISSAAETAEHGTDGAVTIRAPFSRSSKADIATAGAKYGAPLDLSWSCYKGGTAHCGTCGTCRERQEAFQIAQITDPTVYEETA